MLSAELLDHLRGLRTGRFDTASAACFEHLSAQSLIQELLVNYPIVFQRRTLESKVEIGLAREAACVLTFRRLGKSAFPGIHAYPSLLKCFLISAYDDAISEITWVSKIKVRGTENGLVMSFGKGQKLDRTIDGWSIKPLRRRTVILSESVLAAHGWQSDALLPFGFQLSSRTS